MATPLAGHLALTGFMGAGKTTIGAELARRLDRPFVDTDDAVVAAAGASIPELFAHGTFREHERRAVGDALQRREPSVIALGGGAILAEPVRDELARLAFTVWLDVDADLAWARVAGTDRPLAQDEGEFRRLYEERRPLYEAVADARALDADGAILAAGRVHVEEGALARLGELLPGGPVALVADSHVAGIHGADAQLALGGRLASVHEVPAGEPAKTPAVLERLWRDLRLDRGGTIAALGGGATTDLAGFAAAAYLRGIAWAPVATTLLGQVDAAIGGKTAIDLPEGKNLIGAFHWPALTVLDPLLLATLPERERRNGMAEVVKTGLLAGEPIWELPDLALVRRCAAFKTALCLGDPHDRGAREILNLGHTFAHGLETAAGYSLSHGEAVALGMLAALRISGRPTDAVERLLAPKPVRVDRERAWAAMRRDKKVRDGQLRLVLLDDDGPVVRPVPEAEARAALDQLIRR